VRATLRHDPATATARLTLEQTVPPTPGQPDKQPMPLPIRLALFGAKSGGAIASERVHVLDGDRTDILFEGIDEPPVLSINRGFSAPVIVETNRTTADLAFLSAHDDDPFARYEAMQQLMIETLLATIAGREADPAPVIAAVRGTLADKALDAAFVAEAVLLPSEAFLGDQLAEIDPQAIRREREALRVRLGGDLAAEWRAAYAATAANGFAYTPSAKGLRRLRSVALAYLAAGGAADAPALALAQHDAADNMTDRIGALGVLANGDGAERDTALAAFHDRYAQDALVLDKWFTTQALSAREDTPQAVEALAKHADFTIANPNRMRALVGAFAANQYAFHHPSGRGYRFVADMILAADALNPQSAARLVGPFGRWRRLEAGRSALMRAELERIAAAPGLSKDVFEQVSKSLA